MEKLERKRLTVWAIVFILIGVLGAIFLPNDSFTVFVDLIKSIMQSLIM
jgi:hypothetical protein